ncbi:hypothetical protein RYX36_029791 [Vicia faba]
MYINNNTFIVVWVLVVGIGFGGWASITNSIEQIDLFGLFANCYQCNSPAPSMVVAPPPLDPYP